MSELGHWRPSNSGPGRLSVRYTPQKRPPVVEALNCSDGPITEFEISLGQANLAYLRIVFAIMLLLAASSASRADLSVRRLFNELARNRASGGE
jgi:hypothetical protein